MKRIIFFVFMVLVLTIIVNSEYSKIKRRSIKSKKQLMHSLLCLEDKEQLNRIEKKLDYIFFKLEKSNNNRKWDLNNKEQ